MLLLMCAAAMLALHAGLAGARSTTTDPPPAAICGLEGFKLNTLELPPSWSIVVQDRTNCIIPNGAHENNVTGCTIYFSICKVLPAAFCGGDTNSTTCEVVTLTGGTTHGYSIGEYRGNDEFTALGGKDIGFTTIRQGSQLIDGQRCHNEKYETIITWNCDGKKVWDSSSTDASRFVISVSRLELLNCTISINLGYSGACYIAPTVAPDTCQLEPYSFVGLASQPYWTATVPTDNCYNKGSLNCRIIVSFCGILSPELGAGCYGASICQVGTDADGEGYSYSMGQYKTAKYTVNTAVVGGGFHLDVENGSKPDDHRCDYLGGMKTQVTLTCNSSVKWTDEDISAMFYIHSVDLTDHCQYIIALPYEGACEQVGPISGGRNPQSFVGWILIGIFFFAVMVYLMVGAGFEYFVKGARGVEAIPNYAFWMMFFMLALDGCKLSFNVITCFKFEGTIKNPLSGPGKSGIDYDKI